MDFTKGGINRRSFMVSSLAAGVVSVLPGISSGNALFGDNADLTIKDALDLIIKTIPGAPFKDTVDTAKSGDVNQPLKGIVTTMFPTVEIIQKAIQLNANLIIVHEPTYYNHLDETDWLQAHPVWQYKHDLLEKNAIVVWRFHDYWHAHRPDGIRKGVLQALGWEEYQQQSNPAMVRIPVTSLNDVVNHCKTKLGIGTVRIVGGLSDRVERIGLLPGAIGGRGQIEFMQKETPDLLIVGETREWETSEYFRDLRAMGKKQSLLVLGHIASEEPGMKWLVEWLGPKLPGVQITHLHSGDAFLWV